MTCIFKR